MKTQKSQKKIHFLVENAIFFHFLQVFLTKKWPVDRRLQKSRYTNFFFRGPLGQRKLGQDQASSKLRSASEESAWEKSCQMGRLKQAKASSKPRTASEESARGEARRGIGVLSLVHERLLLRAAQPDWSKRLPISETMRRATAVIPG